MRLINTQTLELEEFFGDDIPSYAILSHTWEDGEVTFQDWQDLNAASRKPGYHKIKGACRQARLHDLGYVWVDTNCIDKTSSSELSEAINSMFAWYRNAAVCYVYLVDVPWVEVRDSEDPWKYFRRSRWWTRGWTLQELIAPKQVGFYSREWEYIGNRSSYMASQIERITGIDVEILMDPSRLDSVSVAKRMSWLSRRVTTRVEDRAYCMLGIFDINMPLLYGEGPKAFMRLQEEIIKISNDHTIFCWQWDDTIPSDWTSVLAPSPDVFKYSGNFVSTTSRQGKVSTYSMTNAGLHINVEMIQAWSYYFILLDARLKGIGSDQRACIPVNGSICDVKVGNYLLFHRESFPPTAVFLPLDWKVAERDNHVQSRLKTTIEPPVRKIPPRTDGILLLFDDAKPLLDKELSYTESDRGVYMLERAKMFIGCQTYPADLFDEERGIFLFTFSRSRGISCGFLRLGARKTDGCVVFLAIKLVGGSGVLCRLRGNPSPISILCHAPKQYR